jgi:antitoxin VapB
MSIQLANPTVVEKVNRLAQQTGLTKTALIDRALDVFQANQFTVAQPSPTSFAAVFKQLDQLADLPTHHDPLQWDAMGLPK